MVMGTEEIDLQAKCPHQWRDEPFRSQRICGLCDLVVTEEMLAYLPTREMHELLRGGHTYEFWLKNGGAPYLPDPVLECGAPPRPARPHVKFRWPDSDEAAEAMLRVIRNHTPEIKRIMHTEPERIAMPAPWWLRLWRCATRWSPVPQAKVRR